MKTTQNITNSILSGENQISENSKIFDSFIENSIIEENVEIFKSVIKNSHIKKNSKVGAFANVHSNSIIEENVKIGNFVEIKNSKIGNRTKVSHLSYVGDAIIGEDCNVGAGVIFCNYDGLNKNRTIVGDKVFIGSNSCLIAPLKLEDECFISAGAIVRTDLTKNDFLVSKQTQKLKKTKSLYLQKFQPLKKFFGTDGIRGIFGKEINETLIKNLALALKKRNKTQILLGKDTRENGKILEDIFIKTCEEIGIDVILLGVCSTPCLAFYAKQLKPDYAVMITASHNSKEYNGIKIFNSKGEKISKNNENKIELKLNNPQKITNNNQGKILKQNTKDYEKFCEQILKKDILNLKICYDLANGSLSKFVPNFFKKNSQNVICLNSKGIINENCGSLHPEIIQNFLLENNMDIGFSFDGDGDRVICVNQKGEILNGDEILSILAWHFKANNKLKSNTVVGTILTNLFTEQKLNSYGIQLLRTDVGDHNVSEKLKEENLNLGGESSGHIIINEISNCADGFITSLFLINIFLENQNVFLNFKNKETFQVNKSINLNDINFDKIQNSIYEIKQFYLKKLGKNSQIIIRKSGTEPVLRIMVETTELNLSELISNEIKKKILKL